MVFGVDADGAEMANSDGFGDGETEAGAAVIGGPCEVESGEAMEDALVMFRWDAWAVVGDREDSHLGVFDEVDRDGGSSVTDRVVEKVPYETYELSGIASDLRGRHAR